MFKGKRALVTGAGRGIGRDLVIELHKLEADIIALSRTREHLDTLQKECPGIQIVSVDIGNWKETEAIVRQLGPIDLLINNAGIGSLQEVGSITEEAFDDILAVVAIGMKAKGTGGSIVNVSSQASLVALHQHATYCASKGALDQLTKVFALELAPYQIRVNSVNPTVVLTEMGVKAWGEEKVAKKMKDKIPLGKFCETADVVKAIIFLLSNDSRMITGIQMPIDGGYTVQ